MSIRPFALLLPLLLCTGAYAETPPAPGGSGAPAGESAASDDGTGAEEARRKAALEQAYAAEQQRNIDLAKIRGSEVITLRIDEAGQQREVLALLTPQTRGEVQGTVLLLHDMNAHLDQPGVIAPLRRGLPEAGWHTLSLQLPGRIPEQDTVAWLDTARLRIADALAELDGRSMQNVVIIGHGLGAVAAIDYLSENLVPAVKGLVVIGLDGRANEERRLDAARGLGLLELPLLDIYSAHDRHAVLSSAKRRYDLARRNNDDGVEPRPAYSDIARDYDRSKGLSMSYRQVKLIGTDYDYRGSGAELVKRVRGWLKNYIK